MKNNKEKEIVEYYKNGAVKVKYLVIEDSIKNGYFIEYDSRGNLLTKMNYRNGLPEGKYIDYYSNGNIMAEGNFFKGKKVGWFANYNEAGFLIRKVDICLVDTTVNPLLIKPESLLYDS